MALLSSLLNEACERLLDEGDDLAQEPKEGPEAEAPAFHANGVL